LATCKAVKDINSEHKSIFAKTTVLVRGTELTKILVTGREHALAVRSLKNEGYDKREDDTT
jgi:hypothetical protein